MRNPGFTKHLQRLQENQTGKTPLSPAFHYVSPLLKINMNYTDRNDIIATMKRLGICVIVPTYNNAESLPSVLDNIIEYADDIIVVNDGSTDNTSEILRRYAEKITIVEHQANKGKGRALVSGFKKAIEAGFVTAITIDSDGQHYPSDLPAFIEAIANYPSSIIIGERDLSNVDINGKSSFANKFSNFWFCVQTGIHLHDTQTGYRAYPLGQLGSLDFITSRYEAELEFLVFAAWRGINIISIPIGIYYPSQDKRVSHFKPGLDFTRISILNTILCILSIIYGWPRKLYNAIFQKKVFNFEFKPFTHCKGNRRDASLTLRRIFNTIYGFGFFILTSITVFTPFALLSRKGGKSAEKRRFVFHKALQHISGFISGNYPDAPVKIENPHNETFEKPSLIVCNHQSMLDLPILMSLAPKLIFLTNERVWNSRIYGRIIRTAEFLPVSNGVDNIISRLKELINRGYSVVIFPEGTRSPSCKILRFHKGAFMLAETLGLDIIPLTLHGAGHVLPKYDMFFRKGKITLNIGEKIKAENIAAIPVIKKASLFRKIIKNKYAEIEANVETPEYFINSIRYKYAYRGWKTVTECKKNLNICRNNYPLIQNGYKYKKIRIINCGIGVFPLLYALVNKHTEVHAYESSASAFRTAADTAGIPQNLHYHHAIWQSDRGDDEDFDITINCNHLS